MAHTERQFPLHWKDFSTCFDRCKFVQPLTRVSIIVQFSTFRQKTFVGPPAIIHGASQEKKLNCLRSLLSSSRPSWDLPERSHVLPQGAPGIHNIFLGRRCAVFLLSSVFLSLDVLPEKTPHERTAKETFIGREEDKRRTIPRLGKAWQQWWYRWPKRERFEEILSDCFPQQDKRNSRTQASVKKND